MHTDTFAASTLGALSKSMYSRMKTAVFGWELWNNWMLLATGLVDSQRIAVAIEIMKFEDNEIFL